MKISKPFVLLSLAAFALLNGCSGDPYDGDINWKGDNGGTLELINGSGRDIVVFIGQTPSETSIVGGVRAGITTTFDICKHVPDCDVGGYAVLRGMSREEYEKNWADLSQARIEFNSMATYRRGTKYRVQIDAGYIGDFGFRLINNGKVGIELRKNSPDGEKVAYLGALQQDQIVYTQTSGMVTLFPAYVFFNQSTGEVTTLKSTSMFESISASPRPHSEPLQTYYLPNDETDSWEKIVNTLKSPVAYITVSHSVMNQSARFTTGGSTWLTSQNGYDAIGSGEQLVFEVQSVDEEDGGAAKQLVVMLYGGAVRVPVLKEGETEPPVIKNGYNYTVSVTGSGQDASGYTAKIVEGAKRDLSSQLSSL